MKTSRRIYVRIVVELRRFAAAAAKRASRAPEGTRRPSSGPFEKTHQPPSHGLVSSTRSQKPGASRPASRSLATALWRATLAPGLLLPGSKLDADSGSILHAD
jgi:hypothetical protein